VAINLELGVGGALPMTLCFYLAGHGPFCPVCSGQQHDRQLPACRRGENAGLAQHIVKYSRRAEVGGVNGK
jgi:hypothetical protein